MNRKNFEESKDLLANLLLSQARFNRVGDSLTPNNFKDIFPFLPEDVGESVLRFGNDLMDKKICKAARELLKAAIENSEYVIVISNGIAASDSRVSGERPNPPNGGSGVPAKNNTLKFIFDDDLFGGKINYDTSRHNTDDDK